MKLTSFSIIVLIKPAFKFRWEILSFFLALVFLDKVYVKIQIPSQ